MKKHLPTLLGLALLGAAAFGANLALAARADEDPTDLGAAGEPLLVSTTALRAEDELVLRRRFTGEVEARRSVDLMFEGTGRVDAIRVREGDAVEAGDVLATLDTSLLEARRAEVASRQARLRAQLDELVAGPRDEQIAAARAEVAALEEELAIAVVLRDRRVKLADEGSIPAEDAQTARARASALAARLDGARARLAELEEGTRAEQIAAQRGALGEVTAALDAIDTEIARTRILAPFAGTIAARHLDEGAFVSSMAPVAALRLVETGALEARVGVPPAIAADLADGSARPSLGLRGEELAVGPPRLLPTVEGDTRTVTAVFDLEPGAGAPRPGEIVELVTSVRRAEGGAWVPIGALSASTRGLWTLYAVEPPEGGAADGTAVLRRVEVEVLRTDGERAFVRGTFAGDLRVVDSGAHRVVPGQRVRVADQGAVSGAGSTPSREER